MRFLGTSIAPSVPGPQEAIQTCFQQALTVARRQQAKALELCAALSLYRRWQQQGQRQETLALLISIYDRLIAGFDIADLQDAKRVPGVLTDGSDS